MVDAAVQNRVPKVKSSNLSAVADSVSSCISQVALLGLVKQLAPPKLVTFQNKQRNNCD